MEDNVSENYLTIYHNDKPVYQLNSHLVTRQKVEKNVPAIKRAHETKLDIYDLIKQENNREKLKSHALDIQECEFELQRLWGFIEDAHYHRFWETPKCECPKLDNEDLYGHGRAIISLACPLHGRD